MRTTFVLSALAVVIPALGAPAVVPITKRAGPVKPNSYVIKFEDGSPKGEILDTLTKRFTESGSSIVYSYGDVFNGVAATLLGPDLALVQGMRGVEYVEQDSIMSISYEHGIDGLSSISERAGTQSGPLLSKRADGAGQGEGVNVYGIDTGIYTKHKCFGDRASWGATFGGYKDADGNGHGTHTAGTAVGDKYGIATKASVFAIKVLSDQGSGAMSDVLAGVNWAYNHFKTVGKPSIATMSLGGPAVDKSLNTAIEKAIAGGLHFTVAAGNDNRPADGTSPANVEGANTIGAVDANNQKASFSNYGGLIDVWAPGVNILSAWIDGPDSTKIASGTSMATPYVAGVLAIALGKEPQSKPAELSEKLRVNAKDVVTFAPADTVASVTSNHKLAQLW